MIITAIEPFERGKGRAAIYLNGEFAFVLYKGELKKYELEIGKEIDKEIYDRILNEVLILRAKKRGMNLLMSIDRTEKDIHDKLKESGYPDEAVDAAVEYLKSFGYIDDHRYASDYIGFKRNSMSLKQIKQKLLQKGISQDTIDGVLSENEDDGSGEQELIKKLIVKRVGTDVGRLEYNEKQKLFAYLYNKGFNISDIDKAYNCLT